MPLINIYEINYFNYNVLINDGDKKSSTYRRTELLITGRKDNLESGTVDECHHFKLCLID